MSDATLPGAVLSREELVALVTRAHVGAPYAECKVAGAALADQSKLPRLIAENLGAGFGQWTFFPEASEIVEFASAYAPPATSDDVWSLARQWAADDAASRRTVLALVGKELLQTELRRIDVPELRALFAEPRGAGALVLRKQLGLDVPAPRTPAPTVGGGGDAPSPKRAEARPPRAPKVPAAAVKRVPVEMTVDGVMKMPKPKFERAKREPEPAARHFAHPKFGAGVLERIDGVGDDAKLTIRFPSGTKTLLARFVTEVVEPARDAGD
jgi:hypothetical protein